MLDPPGGTPCALTCFFRGIIGLPHGKSGSAFRVYPANYDFSQGDSRGCRYSVMFRPPSLLAPRSFLPLRILPQGSRGFYVRAYRAPPHAPDMLTVRIQVTDGTGTFTLSDSQPCRLLLSRIRLSDRLHHGAHGQEDGLRADSVQHVSSPSLLDTATADGSGR